MTQFLSVVFVFIALFARGGGWRAVPANQAMYATRSITAGIEGVQLGGGKKKNEIPHELLPRTYIHSIYKFGYCPPDVTRRQYLRTTVNMSIGNYQESHAEYLYVIADLSTQRFKLQCVVLKAYVPRIYLFRKSRIPMYYCQGRLYIMVFETIHRLAIHEFYMASRINMPVDFYFEFYHPTIL